MKKTIFAFILVFILSSSMLPSFAYDVPSTTSFTWQRHSTLNSTFTSAVQSAASTWNSSSTGFTFNYSSTIFYGNINVDDSYSVIAYSTIDDPTLPYDWGGVTYIGEEGHEYFDIVFNPDLTWGDGNSTSYYDRQGAATHEFGHAMGLDDYNYGVGPYPWTSPSQVATMYCALVYNGYPCSYYLRTLATTDINAAISLASQV
jgi:hypothetical protein